MQKTITIGAIVLAAIPSAICASDAQFCRGFAQGYLEGWNGQTIQAALATGGSRDEKPVVPACHIGPTDNDDDSTLSSFEQGEQKGIQRGIKAYKDDLGSGSATDTARRTEAEEAAKAAAAEAATQRAIAAKRQAEDAKRQEAIKDEAIREHQLALQRWLPGVTAALMKCVNKYYGPSGPTTPTGSRPMPVDGYCENINNLDVIEYACKNAVSDPDRAHLGCGRLKTTPPSAH
jgi:hypothetical protein